jgi:hypothetical protein
MFTLTIYFFVLNVNVEFVLIYRPHPVCPGATQACVVKADPDQHWPLLSRDVQVHSGHKGVDSSQCSTSLCSIDLSRSSKGSVLWTPQGEAKAHVVQTHPGAAQAPVVCRQLQE